ncbi:MAG: type VI secretion system tip protein VgrG [Polyangiaceae bacterium]|nr:type VI secretion system tip protein VgrG [Polyangiaceae bacterium]
MNKRLDHDRGNEADYLLGTPEGWDAFDVVRWHGKEEVSAPYEFDITLRRAIEKGPVDLDNLMGAPATFRVATAHRWRTIHGILAETEEVDRTRTFFYYRVLLVPPMWQMRFRRRCRTFVYRSMKDILTCLLEGRAHPGAPPAGGLLALSGRGEQAPEHPDWEAFHAPHGRFVWRVTDEKRLTNTELHPFVAQYNESDFDFLTRWLAHEGVSYYFEHHKDSVVMILTDAPGQEAPFETDRVAKLMGGAIAGATQDQEVVRFLRDARRMRARGVTMREYDFHRSNQVFDAQMTADDPAVQALSHFEFPAKDRHLSDKLASFPAQRRLERFEVERRLRQGHSTLRTLTPGHALRVTDHDNLRDDDDLLIVRSETFATQHGMDGSLIANDAFGFSAATQKPGDFENRFDALPTSVSFRPAAPRDKEKIWGIQTARVWGPDTETNVEDGDGNKVTLFPVDIHCDEHNRVRVRFPWDTRQDGQPSSDWCRVAQSWAGNGYGAMHIPRVGHEVLVAFENGDPDKPVIVGSVYTRPDTPPPYDTTDAKNKTRTGIKSCSTNVTEPAEGYNEFRFTDYKGQEEVYLQAERDLNELVKASHSTTVGGDQSNSVGGNQTNTVKGYRIHDITGDEVVHVHGNRNTDFDANENHNVAVNRTTNIGAVEKLEVGSSRLVVVHGPDMAIVDSDDVTEVHGARTVQVDGDHTAETKANYHSSANANHTFKSTNMYITQAGEFQVNATSLWLNVGGCSIKMSAGCVSISDGQGASVLLTGGNIVLAAAGTVLSTSAGSTNLMASTLNGAAGTIHWNG